MRKGYISLCEELNAGIVCAILAFLIVRAEMALFDLKEGFCSTSWGTAKRFCCAPRHRNIPGTDPEVCGDWIEWGEFFDPGEEGGRQGAWIWGGPEFSAYIVIAVSRQEPAPGNRGNQEPAS